MIISTGKATLYELQTIYSLEDMYDMLEVIQVDAANTYIINKQD